MAEAETGRMWPHAQKLEETGRRRLWSLQRQCGSADFDFALLVSRTT